MNEEKRYELGQSYIRFDFKANKNFKIVFEKYLLYKGKTYAREFYHKELLVEGLYFAVELEEGSLKSRLKIYGRIAIGALSALTAYGGMRTGIDYIIRDSQTITENIVQDIYNDENINPNSIKRVERRLGAPGRIKRLYGDIERLRANRENLTEKQQQELINRISRQFKHLVNELDQPELELIANEIRENDIPVQRPGEKKDIDFRRSYAIREKRIRLISEDEIDEIKHLPPPTD